MIERILKPIVAWTTGTIAVMGYPGIVLMMAIESACIPLPVSYTHLTLPTIYPV